MCCPSTPGIGTRSRRVPTSLQPACKVADGQATLSVYGYDSYLPEDIDALQEGSVLRIHDQGDTTVTKLTVTSIDRDTDNGYVTINGGIEAGGVELTLNHDVYRTVTFDDYPRLL